MKKLMSCLILSMVIGMSLAGCIPKEEQKTVENVKTVPLIDEKDNYLSVVDVEYAFEFAKSLEQFKTNEKLGFRTAGSVEEIEIGEQIGEEMKRIGLVEVTKDEFKVDMWEFEKADLTFTDSNGEEHLVSSVLIK
ncbi:hypothetical protein [Sporosarcina sp. G11-34]|uniref:hypothetical protein n=1 Tax=Sporosarcina sp. G11-34 TaxID=2849605 RepID=UPI0022A9229E|nr:hypothetical protein [Sporosarcina sp. G11-34]MCZ2259876.1 hypothetical protein [Sporosarcina sp. G11-34]